MNHLLGLWGVKPFLGDLTQEVQHWSRPVYLYKYNLRVFYMPTFSAYKNMREKKSDHKYVFCSSTVSSTEYAWFLVAHV